ncbi:hypothetical protein [Citreimonas salinaria]|uniref:LPP20 lipoprotein n=1 Tax=Citreimonas salinaria TaxID=321339 RepID=A0A1H3MW89_9RHOB|nr:hypothetical protein [Citreimonas salinaria]SDY80987.1 hypothetical protein SAMN05444340_1192 [Citreimonas salinaria]
MFARLVTSLVLVAFAADAQPESERYEYTARYTDSGFAFDPENDAAVELDRTIGFNRKFLLPFAANDEATGEIERAIQEKVARSVGQTMQNQGNEAAERLVKSWIESGIEVEVRSSTGEIVTASFEDPGMIAGVSRAALRKIAQDAASELFSSAVESACGASIRPTEISPSFSVSFNLFAGAEFTIAAMFETDRVCADAE